MDSSRATAARLREREEIVSTLHILMKSVPPLLTLVCASAAVLAVVGAVRGYPDRAALTVALTTVPCVALSWITRYLTASLLDNLDLLPDPESDSPRR